MADGCPMRIAHANHVWFMQLKHKTRYDEANVHTKSAESRARCAITQRHLIAMRLTQFRVQLYAFIHLRRLQHGAPYALLADDEIRFHKKQLLIYRVSTVPQASTDHGRVAAIFERLHRVTSKVIVCFSFSLFMRPTS